MGKKISANQLLILSVAVIISLLGITSIYSSTNGHDSAFWGSICQRQISWFLFGLALFFIFSRLNYRHLWDWTYFLYGTVLFFLLLVCVIGAVRLGAQRWFRLAWFGFQPSEAAKLIVIVFLSRYYSRKGILDTGIYPGDPGIWRSLILPFIIAAVPMCLIIEQPDLGSGLLVLLFFIAMVYVAGVRLKYIIVFFIAMALPLPFFWHILHGYQKDRLTVFLNPNIDPLGAGYTIIQSRIAIGSGAFFGKGWLSGTQSQLHFLPESHTDFIFASFIEQWGFLGGILLLFLYCLLIRRGFIIAGRAHDNFGRLLAQGISLMLGIQVFINIAMNMGLAPVVGIPLPLMSYGGSSLLVSFMALGILASIDRRST